MSLEFEILKKALVIGNRDKVLGQPEGGREQTEPVLSSLFGRKCLPDTSPNSMIVKYCLKISRHEFVSTNHSFKAVKYIVLQAF